jgi:hypothetical protein
MNDSIYIFRPEEHSDEELFEIVRDREQLQKDGFIGECLMRRIAQKQKNSIGGSYSVLDMEGIAARAAFEIIRRRFPCELSSGGEYPHSLRAIEAAMQKMPHNWRMRWCEAQACACMGCVNRSGGLQQLGFTKEQWTAWKNSLSEEDKKAYRLEREKYFSESFYGHL